MGGFGGGGGAGIDSRGGGGGGYTGGAAGAGGTSYGAGGTATYAVAATSANGSASLALLPIVSLTGTAPTAFGPQLAALAVTGNEARGYTADRVTFLGGVATAYVSATGFASAADPEVYALKLQVNGTTPTAAQVADLVADIGGDAVGVTAAPVTGAYAGLFPGYTVLLTSTSGFTPTGYFGFDFTADADAATPNVTVTAVGVVPEPTGLLAGAFAAAGALLGRRRRRVVKGL